MSIGEVAGMIAYLAFMAAVATVLSGIIEWDALTIYHYIHP